MNAIESAHLRSTSNAARYIGLTAAAYAVIGGLISLLGWVLEMPRLTDWWGSGIGIKANTAVAFMGCGFALMIAILLPSARIVTRALGLFAAAVGGLTIFQHITLIDLGIDTLLFDEPPGAPATSAPGRMGPPASMGFVGIGLALMLMPGDERSRATSVRLAMFVLAIGLLSITGYWYGAEAMYTIPRLTGIALQSATMMVALSVGLLAGLPEREPARTLFDAGNTGMLARRVIAAAFIIPLMLGWLRVSGQRAGLYDHAFGTAMRTVIEIAILSGVLWWIVQTLRERDLRQRHLEVERHSSDQRLAQTLESMSDGFLTLDADWRFSYLNAEAERVLGKPRFAVLGRKVHDVYPELLKPEVRAQIEHAVREKRMLEMDDVDIDTDGKRHFRTRIYPAADGGVSVYFQDVTTRKHAENALLEADRRKDVFLATLAHELRNPLAPIRNAAVALQRQHAADPTLRWASGIIERQVRHMARLLDDLLDVSRISRNRLELRREWVDLTEVLRTAVETSQPVIDAAAHTLSVTLPAEPIYVDGDAVRLAQVFSNLLNNAAKYTPHGGRISIAAQYENDEVVVRVADNGIGIDSEALPRIFDMFTQASSELPSAQEGLGIGLALARGIAELHGGHIEAHSAGKGSGSEFVVRLPRLREEPAAAETAPLQATESRLRILIVDDLQDSADSLATLLDTLGHETRAVYSGLAALEIGPQFRPDVILLDIGMPELDGLQTCMRLRETPWGKAAYVIAMTGWGQSEDRQRTSDAGFDTHLIKPADVEKLLGLLASVTPAGRTQRDQEPRVA